MKSPLSSLPGRPFEILLVEDDDGDAFLTERALRKGGPDFTLHLVTTGEEALDYVHQRGEHLAAPRPDLVLLDLNLPGVDGKYVLDEMKQTRSLRRIPVVVLTSSRAESDILRSLDLHANTYMVKPGDPSIFDRMAQAIRDYWMCAAMRIP